ncbi:MAG: hypothetical protein JXR52_05030 [Bacteroidales bacterium]|nr:hypothetical protein [Bacteroidales bacterium]MBN2698168.1 hypothetical protein [Bacteroidales bacterium]
MNQFKKRQFYFFALLTAIFCAPFLSAQTEEQKKRFEEEQIAFFNQELQLTEKEAEKFWPIYNDFNNRKMRIMEEEKNLLWYFNRNSENISAEEIDELLTKYLEINERKNQLERDYHNEFKKILPPKKVMMLYVADRQFRMHLIRQIRHHGQSPEGRMKRGGPDEMNQSADKP